MTDHISSQLPLQATFSKSGISLHPFLAGLLFVLASGAVSEATAQGRDLDEQRAFLRAVQILKGDPYGQTFTEVANVIKRATFSQSGQSPCSNSKIPVWVFRIQTEPLESNSGQRIEGDLVINARTGRIECASLPFLS